MTTEHRAQITEKVADHRAPAAGRKERRGRKTIPTFQGLWSGARAFLAFQGLGSVTHGLLGLRDRWPVVCGLLSFRGLWFMFCGLLLVSCTSVPAAEVARRHIGEGNGYYERKEYADALDCYDAAVQTNPRDPEAYLHRANAHLRIARDPEGEGTAREHEDQALANYTECLRLNPVVASAHFNRAMIWAKRANYKQAASDLLNCAKLNDRDPEPHLLIGQLYEEKFEDPTLLLRAMEHYEKFLALGGRNEEIRRKVETWKQLQSAAAAEPKPAPDSDPVPAEEKKAEALFEEWKKLFAAEDRAGAGKVIRELLEKYPHTKVVQERRRSLEAVLRSLDGDGEKQPEKP